MDCPQSKRKVFIRVGIDPWSPKSLPSTYSRAHSSWILTHCSFKSSKETCCSQSNMCHLKKRHPGSSRQISGVLYKRCQKLPSDIIYIFSLKKVDAAARRLMWSLTTTVLFISYSSHLDKVFYGNWINSCSHLHQCKSRKTCLMPTSDTNIYLYMQITCLIKLMLAYLSEWALYADNQESQLKALPINTRNTWQYIFAIY